MANRVKTISKYSGSAWGTEVPIGADATNVDMTTAPSDYDSSTSETSKTLIGTNDVKVIASDTDLTAWGKFNRFRRRVSNKFADYFATGSLVTSATGVTTSGTDSQAYTAKALNDYFANVIGYASESDLPSSADTVASQLSSLNNKVSNRELKWYYTSKQTVSDLNVWEGNCGYKDFTFIVPSTAYDIEPVAEANYLVVNGMILSKSGTTVSAEIVYVAARRTMYGSIGLRLRYHT